MAHPTEINALVDVVSGEDIKSVDVNRLNAASRALLVVLGDAPQGGAATVQARILAHEQAAQPHSGHVEDSELVQLSSDLSEQIGGHAQGNAHDVRYAVIVIWNGSWPTTRPEGAVCVFMIGGTVPASWAQPPADIHILPTSTTTPPPAASLSLTNTLDGPNGAAVTEANTASYGIALIPSIGTGASITYDTATPVEGSASARLQSPGSGTAVTTFLTWNKTVLGKQSKMAAGVRTRWSAAAVTNNLSLLRIMHEQSSTPGTYRDIMVLRHNLSTNRLNLMNRNFGTTLWTSTAAPPAGTAITASMMVDLNALTVQVRFVAGAINEDSGPLSVTAGDLIDPASGDTMDASRVDFGTLTNQVGFTQHLGRVSAGNTFIDLMLGV